MRNILFLDVDGTLVDYENHLPSSAIKAIQLARLKGHLVYICTGRSKAEIPKELLTIGFDGLIGGNGAYIEHDGQVLWYQVLPLELEIQIVDWLNERGLAFYLESHRGLFASRNFKEAARPVFKAYMLGKKERKERIGQLEAEDVLHGLRYGAPLYQEDISKISFILRSNQDYRAAKTTFPELKVGTWGGKGEKALFGDFGLLGVDKGRAIRFVLDYLKEDKSTTIAIGDAKVDIPMFKACQIGVAMGNARPEIKKEADLVTDDVTLDGLYKAFEFLHVI